MSKSRQRLKVDIEESVLTAASAEVGRMVDSSQADDRKMIRLVKARRLLYARNNMPVASYYTTVKRLWQEVAHEMGCTVADVRRKWSHIRNSYSRHLRNEMHGARTGKGRMVSKWYLADELQFLREHMATDTRSSPYSSYTPSFLSIRAAPAPAGAGAGGAPAEALDIKPFIHNPWFSLSRNAQAFEPPPLDDTSSSHTFEPDENSAYFHFFRGIYNDYQELPTRKQRLFRRQCLNFLHSILDEEERHSGMDEQSDAINLTSALDTDADADAEADAEADAGADVDVEPRSDDDDHKFGVLDKVHGFHILPDE